ILGFGGIGSEIARRSKAFDMHVVGLARSPPRKGIADAVGTLEDLPRYLPQADVVFLALPLTRATHGLMDRVVLARMKEDAILVNEIGRASCRERVERAGVGWWGENKGTDE